MEKRKGYHRVYPYLGPALVIHSAVLTVIDLGKLRHDLPYQLQQRVALGRVSITVSFFLFYGLILYLAMREKDKLSVLGALAVMALSLMMFFMTA